MGTLFVFVSHCFRKNVVVTGKIGSFLCSLDNLLPKKCNWFLFWKSNVKMALIWKKGWFWPTFHIFSRQGKLQKILQHIYHLHTYMYFAHPIDFFFALPILKKKKKKYQVWFLFGMSPGVDSYLRYFGTINKQQNGEQNLSWNVYYWYVFTLMPNLRSFVNRRLWMTDVKTQFSTEIAKSTAS